MSPEPLCRYRMPTDQAARLTRLRQLIEATADRIDVDDAEEYAALAARHRVVEQLDVAQRRVAGWIASPAGTTGDTDIDEHVAAWLRDVVTLLGDLITESGGELR